MQKYQILQVIGEGAYGVVLKCQSNQTKEILAIKKFKETQDDQLVRKVTMREVKILKNMKHPNIVQLKDAFRKKGIVYLVFEYVQNNLLEVLEKTPSGLDPQLIKRIIFQLVTGLYYMHSNNIIHRDIKPQNLLISDTFQLKICDFGFARTYKKQGQEYTDYVATRWYRPPQLLVGAPYDNKIDIWAIGCIMAELIDGNPLFPGENQFDQLFLIQKCLGSMTSEHMETFLKNPRFNGMKFSQINNLQTLDKRYLGKITQKGMNFLKSTLKLNPSQRISAIEALRHPYFQSLKTSQSIRKHSANTNNLRQHSNISSSLNDEYPNSISYERKKIQTNMYNPSVMMQKERQKTESSPIESLINTRGYKFNHQSNNQSKINKKSKEEIINFEFTSKGFNPIHSKSVNKTGPNVQHNQQKINKMKDKFVSIQKGPKGYNRDMVIQTQAGFYKNNPLRLGNYNEIVDIKNLPKKKSPQGTNRIYHQKDFNALPKSRNGKNKTLINTEQIFEEQDEDTFSSTQLPFLMVASQQTQASITKKSQIFIPSSSNYHQIPKQKHKIQYGTGNPNQSNLNIIAANNYQHHHFYSSPNKNF